MDNDIKTNTDWNNSPPLCGTEENAICWCNSSSSGITCCIFVNLLIVFSTSFIEYNAYIKSIDLINGLLILALTFLSLWSYWSTMLGDPGAVPSNAHPLDSDIVLGVPISVCGRCNTYKPPGVHHDSVSDRCISRMDHYCPWVNNAIGARNQKNFFLFLIYTDITAIYTYVLIAIKLVAGRYINVISFQGPDLIIARILIFVLFFGILFLSAVIITQIYGLSIGLGTIDRATNSKLKSQELGTPVTFEEVFGVNWLSYFIPIDPTFDNEEKIFRYEVKKEPFLSYY